MGQELWGWGSIYSLGQELKARAPSKNEDVKIDIDRLETQVIGLKKELEAAHDQALDRETKTADTIMIMTEAEKQSQADIARCEKELAGYKEQHEELHQKLVELKQKLLTCAGPTQPTSAPTSKDYETAKGQGGFMGLS